jgi:ABC-type sugar transport system substrate-binding protein
MSFTKLSAALAAALLVAGCSSGTAATPEASSGASEQQGSISGKRVLVVPYWLDDFNTAQTSWVKRLLAEENVTVDIINPNAVASKQLNAIETGIASQRYDLIVWQPVDSATALPTVKKIQQAKLLSVLDQAGFVQGTDGISVPQTKTDNLHALEESGKAAAEYVKAHPELGDKPLIAYMDSLPTSQMCQDRMTGFVNGAKSVTPEAELVFTGNATNQEDARAKLDAFISSGKKFNTFTGCGGQVTNGGMAAINAAGLGKATDNNPAAVFVSGEATPQSFRWLWDPTSSYTRAFMFGPKSAAESLVSLIRGQLAGEIAYNEPKETEVKALTLDTECEAGRTEALAQYQGVEGFDLPAC